MKGTNHSFKHESKRDLTPFLFFSFSFPFFAGVAQAAGLVSGSAQYSAGRGAMSTGMGNVSMGNVSLSSLSANKFNPAVESSTGATSRQYGTSLDGGYAPARYGYVTPGSGSTQLTLSSLGGGISVQVGKRASHELQEAYNTTMQQAQEVFTSEASQFRETLSHQADKQTSSQTEHGYGKTFGRESSSQKMRMSSAMDRISKQLSDRGSVSAEEAREIAQHALFAKAVSGGLGLSGSVGKSLGLGSLGFGLEGRGGLRGEKRDENSAGVKAKHQHAFDEAYNAISDQEAREAWSLHEQSRSSDQAKQELKTAAGKRESAMAAATEEGQRMEGFRDLASQIQSLSNQMSQAEGRSVSLNQDQTAALVQYISQQSGKPESQVAAQIGDAIKFNLMDRTGIGGKNVSQWSQEWYAQNRPVGEGISEGASSLKGDVPERIQEQRTAITGQRGETSSSVMGQQESIQSGVERKGVKSRLSSTFENLFNCPVFLEDLSSFL